MECSVITAWLCSGNAHNVHGFVITHPCPKLNICLAKQSFKLGYWWKITSYYSVLQQWRIRFYEKSSMAAGSMLVTTWESLENSLILLLRYWQWKLRMMKPAALVDRCGINEIEWSDETNWLSNRTDEANCCYFCAFNCCTWGRLHL